MHTIDSGIASQRSGEFLHNLISHHNLNLLAGSPHTHISRVRNNRPAITDLVIRKNLTYSISTSVINALSCDHFNPVFNIYVINLIAYPFSVTIDWKILKIFLITLTSYL